MHIELSDLSLKELKALQARIEKEIAGFGQREKNRALEALEAKARELGFSLAELTGTGPTRKRSASAPKYANPANAADTWSGRGRKPRWFAEALAAGKSESDLAI